MNEERKVDEVLAALQMQAPRSGFTARTLQAIAVAEQARRLKQMVWSLVFASGASIAATALVVASGFLQLADLSATAAVFASKLMPWLRLASSAVQMAPAVFVVVLLLACLCCAATTLLLERSVRARA